MGRGKKSTAGSVAAAKKTKKTKTKQAAVESKVLAEYNLKLTELKGRFTDLKTQCDLTKLRLMAQTSLLDVLHRRRAYANKYKVGGYIIGRDGPDINKEVKKLNDIKAQFAAEHEAVHALVADVEAAGDGIKAAASARGIPITI